jgi:hypothetical protein
MSRKLRIEHPGAMVEEGRRKDAEWTGGPAKGHNAFEVDRPALAHGQLDLRLQPTE